MTACDGTVNIIFVMTIRQAMKNLLMKIPYQKDSFICAVILLREFTSSCMSKLLITNSITTYFKLKIFENSVFGLQ